MGMFSASLRRAGGEQVKKEDDPTPTIKDFFEKQEQVRSYEIIYKSGTKIVECVDVDGHVHIHKDDIYDDGTLGFKLKKVTGNLICHVKSISHTLLPEELGGSIIFDVESAQTPLPAKATTAPRPQHTTMPEGLEYLSDKRLSKKDIEKIILTAFYEAEYNKEKSNIDYDINRLIKIFNSEKDKTYRLEIEPKKEKGKDDRIFINCHIYITDEKDNRTEVKMKAQEKAVYLLFLLHENGIYIKDFNSAKKKGKLVDLYAEIQRKLVGNNEIQCPVLSSGDVTPIRTKIRNKISNITQNKKFIEQFSIEGYKGERFMIRAATEEHRELIKNAFDRIDWSKYDLK